MKVIVRIGHPAHVHFFHPIISRLIKGGAKVKIVVKGRELTTTNFLLRHYGYTFEEYGGSGRTSTARFTLFFKLEYSLYKIVKNFDPDLIVGIGGPYFTHVGKILDIPTLLFTDTEDAYLINKLAFPFASYIITPNCFNSNVPYTKHKTYNGFHELSYLHPEVFNPDIDVLDDLDLSFSDRFSLVRFSSWDSSHDIGQSGFKSMDERIRLINFLEEHSRVFITSEIPLPSFFEKYRLTISPEKIHSLLYFATLYIGEGLTMGTEASVLGTPSITISTRTKSLLGNQLELSKNNLLFTFNSLSDAFSTLEDIFKKKNIKKSWKINKDLYLKNKINVSDYTYNLIKKVYKETIGVQLHD